MAIKCEEKIGWPMTTHTTLILLILTFDFLEAEGAVDGITFPG
jgi:hypothetical protein